MMSIPTQKPTILILPGASLNPAHYALLIHHLMQAGYPVLSALLPSAGTSAKITVEDDVEYIRNRLILPLLETEERDVIVLMHSYSSLPGSAAAKGLSKAERGGKKGVVGKIYLAAILAPGGDGKDLMGAFGGQAPPHIQVDEAANLIRCADPGPPLFHDVLGTLGTAAVASCLNPSLTSFTSSIPAASWSDAGYKGRCAYIKTTEDRAVPVQVQEMMLAGTGQEWIVREVATSHDAQMAKPEELAEIMVELAVQFASV